MFFAVLVLPLTSCFENVEKLHHGVKYNPCGQAPKIESLEVVYGKWNTCGACCEIVEYPASPVVKTFTQSTTEDSPTNEEFCVPLGTSVVCFDYSIDFQIKTSDDAKKTFMACKSGKDFKSYIEVNLKNNMRDVFKRVLTEFKTPEALIDSTILFETKCNRLLASILIKDGITLNRGTVVNRLRFPAKTQAMLEDIQTMKTRTMKAEADSKASELESKSRITKAEADSRADIMEAEAAAKVKAIEAETEANRIRKINSALTPQYLELLRIQNYTYKTEYITPTGGVVKLSQKEEREN